MTTPGGYLCLIFSVSDFVSLNHEVLLKKSDAEKMSSKTQYLLKKWGVKLGRPGVFFFVPKIGLDLPFLEGKPMVNKPIIIRSAISGRGKGRGPGG